MCEIFDQKSRWLKAAAKAENKWGIQVSTLMAIMHQESRFDAKAKPPRKTKSSARGYAQAKKATWKWYIQAVGNRGADRDNFKDSVDFVGWYVSMSRSRNGILLSDVKSLYLAYHEGHGGFAKGSWKKKPWLSVVADRVAKRAKLYSDQYQDCRKK